MLTEVTCRGCGIRVARAAHTCYACRCPFPTCHLPELPQRSVQVQNWGWTGLVAFGVVFAGVAVASMSYLALHWDSVHSHSLPSIKANISGRR